MRVVIDTNVLARATPGKGGPAAAVIDEVLDSPHLLILSAFILTELARVLCYERLRAIHGLTDNDIGEYVRNLQLNALLIDVADPLSVAGDPDDDPIIATAIAGNAEVLCTLDRHFYRDDVRSYCAGRGVAVMSDVELLERLRKQ